MSRRSYIRAVIHHVWLKQSDAGRKNWGKEDAVVVRLVSLMVLHGLNPFVCRRREIVNLDVAGAGKPGGGAVIDRGRYRRPGGYRWL